MQIISRHSCLGVKPVEVALSYDFFCRLYFSHDPTPAARPYGRTLSSLAGLV